MSKKIAIIGANGFIGRYLFRELEGDVLPLSRREIGDFNEVQNWGEILAGCDTVIHLAARVHQVHERAQDEDTYMRDNAEMTDKIARGAVEAGVKTFIFLSSAAVYGGSIRDRRRSFHEGDTPNPQNAYAKSKYEAEQILENKVYGSMRCVIIRAPMVYGPECGANFLMLARAVRKGTVLPLASVKNIRSFLYVGNLAGFIQHAIEQGRVRGVYNLSDDEDVSTPALIRAMADCMGIKAKLLPFPAGVISLAGHLAGYGRQADGLLKSFRLDIARAKDSGWVPETPLNEGLQKTLAEF